ncbi:hypothetical protein F4808DRAFT_520 [Astrocystis sublimbata]|nr:hypothetical protein F4808DRAFT_520 [Astrocystis sublimbata]
MSFTLMPFLYQTRTILRIPAHRSASRPSARLVRCLHATARPAAKAKAQEYDIPFDYDVGPPGEEGRGSRVDPYYDEDATETPAPAPAPRKGTITPSERQIFERIFVDIGVRGLKPVTRDDGPVTDPGPAVDGSAIHSTRLIMQQAAYDVGQARPATISAPALLAGVARDRASSLLRFPPQLRAAAEKTLERIRQEAGSKYEQPRGHPTHTDADADAHANTDAGAADGEAQTANEWRAPAHTFARTIELEAKRRPERTRIENLITSAQSDFELWDILEKEVFTMPARLGLADKADGNQPEASTTPSDADPTSSEPQQLSLYVHGPLYPAYLLLALRRLDTAFSEPSMLVFSVLSRIKELGLESYVLGVSTPFFNDLLSIYWTRRGDLAGMLAILEEMRHCGVYFDNRTASILDQVDHALGLLDTGKAKSGFGRALMMMPEYEAFQRDRIRHWHREVDISVREKQDDIEYMEASASG